MKIDESIQSSDLLPGLDRFWALSGDKVRSLAQNYDAAQGSPVLG